MLDGKGRRILFANLNEGRSMDACVASGWMGVLSLPVVISLAPDRNTICYEPATELQAFRQDLAQRQEVGIGTDMEIPLPEARGDCLELDLEMEPRGASEFGLKVRCAPDGSEETLVSSNVDFCITGGDYDFMMREQEVRATQKEAAYERQQAMIAKMKRFIDRFGTHVAKAAQAQSKQNKIDKIDQLEPPRKREVVSFQFRQPARSGDDVVKLQGVDKAYGDKRIYQGLDFDVQRGERWCVMGQNGSGKTTLLKMVAGHLSADAGTVKLGSVKMGYFAQQSLDLLDNSLTIYEQVDQQFHLESIGAKRALLGAFGFSGDDHEKRVANLSGGEKSRLVLALMLFDPPNFLVLDEPTNHLDLDTKEMLVKTLSTFEGTMLFVSHDRTFLRGLANRVLDVSACKHGQPADRYPGSYIEWVEKTGMEAPGVHS
ncbi:MAG TPA: ATP-binding cassette domain-containing protein [Planctomycetes bacterium]|nr:ATP-binding cassette domain-containing protein [Planctomycetota bacterium]